MKNMKNKALHFLPVLALLIVSLICSGCAPLLIAGGAVGGYAVAKNAESSDPGSSQKK